METRREFLGSAAAALAVVPVAPWPLHEVRDQNCGKSQQAAYVELQ
jgi:hypothetical protein